MGYNWQTKIYYCTLVLPLEMKLDEYSVNLALKTRFGDTASHASCNRVNATGYVFFNVAVQYVLHVSRQQGVFAVGSSRGS